MESEKKPITSTTGEPANLSVPMCAADISKHYGGFTDFERLLKIVIIKFSETFWISCYLKYVSLGLCFPGGQNRFVVKLSHVLIVPSGRAWLTFRAKYL